MKQLVDKVSCSVIITLEDGTNIDISLVTGGSISAIKNYITSLEVLESTNAQNKNPVGVVSSNTVKITLNSNDRTLLPDNEQSPYYGKMNTNAKVKVTVTDDEGSVTFNTFYVSSWVSNISSDNPTQVVIEATDLLSIINKNAVTGGEILKDVGTRSVFLAMLTRINSEMPEKYKLKYNETDITFNRYPYIEATNFDASNISTWFNTLCQSTLTNLYLTREDLLVTDDCLDDKPSESVCTLSDKVNITRASVDKGGLVNYNSVKVNYIINSANAVTRLTTMSGQVLTPGVNTLDNINIGSSIYKLAYVQVVSDSKILVEIESVSYSKNTATIVLKNNAQANVTCDIEIYGQSVKENKRFVTKNKSSSGNETLEVTNSILPSSYIESFANNLLRLIGIRASTLSISGYFNPRIKLGDTVYVDTEKSINAKGYYKVTELKWKISNVLKCEAKVVKTIV